MPTFDQVPLQEAMLKTATGKPTRITQEYLGYIELLTQGQAVGDSNQARIRAWPPFGGGSVSQLSYRAKILPLNGKGTKCTFGV